MKQIAFITDIHLDEQFPIDKGINSKENWIRTLDDISKRGIQDIIFGGDIGAASAHPWFFETLLPFSAYIVLGNHDRFDEVSKHYAKGSDLKELYYTLEDHIFKYIFLDTSSDSLSETQLQWLKSQLETAKKALLFMHHPVIAVDTPVDKLYPLKNRTELQLLLIAYAKPVTVFCGHYHMNDESTYKNITQLITKSLSYQVMKQANDFAVEDTTKIGYRLIQLKEDAIVTQCCDLDLK